MFTTTDFNEFIKHRETLLGLMQRLIAVLGVLDMEVWQANVRQMEAQAQANSFKVLVMGEFSRGKSTVINALLKEDVLPSYAKPTTAIINEVKWGEEKRAVLYERATRKAVEVPVEQLKKYVTINDNYDAEDGRQVPPNPYEKVELFWPLDLCREGVEVIDSPGLNEDEEREQITTNYLKTVDAVVFVIACDFPVSRSEKRAIQMFKDIGHESPFFVCNRINLIRPREQADVKQRCLDLLAPHTSAGGKYVFFVNALGALDGFLEGDMVAVEQSHMPEFEAELKTFLATEKGRIKLLRPATGLKSAIREAQRTSKDKDILLNTDIKEIQARYNHVKEKLTDLQMKRSHIVGLLESFRGETRVRIEEAASYFYAEVADKINGWIQDYEVQERMTILEVFSPSARERVAEETLHYLTDQVSLECKQWQESRLQPIFNMQLNSLTKMLDVEMNEFALNLVQARLDLVADVDMPVSPQEAYAEKIGIMERIFAAASGLVLGDISSAALGLTFGFQEMFKSLIPQLAIMIGVGLLTAWNPAIIIPAILVSGGFQAFLKVNAINKAIRNGAGKLYAEKLRGSRMELVRQMSNDVDGKLLELKEAFDDQLNLEIQTVQEQMDVALIDKEKGQAAVEQKLGELKVANHELDAIAADVDELIQQVALTSRKKASSTTL